MGNSKSYQGLDYLLDAVKIIRSKRAISVKLNLILSGKEHLLINKLEQLKLREDTEFHSNVKHELVQDFIMQSDLLVIPRPSLPMTEYAFPSKLPEYLASGIPTITTDTGPVNELFDQSDFLFIIQKNNITNEIVKKIIEFSSMSEDRRIEMGQKARIFVEGNLDWEVLGDKINDSIKKII